MARIRHFLQCPTIQGVFRFSLVSKLLGAVGTGECPDPPVVWTRRKATILGVTTMPNAHNLLMALLLATLLVGCSSNPSVRTRMEVPARFPEAARLQQVAVVTFDGQNGRDFTAKFEGILAGIRVNNKPQFSVIDRTQVEKVLKEMQFGQSGVVSEQTAVRLGNMVGAKAIFTGVIGTNQFTKEDYYDNSQRKACVKKTAALVVTPKMINVQSGQIVYAKTISMSRSFDSCALMSLFKSEPSAESMTADLRQEFAQEISRDFAPQTIDAEVQLLDDPKGISSSEGKARLDRGLEFAKGGRMDRACEIWNSALPSESNAPSLLYDVGLCNELNSEFQTALDFYRKSDRLHDKPMAVIGDAIKRMEDKIKAAGK